MRNFGSVPEPLLKPQRMELALTHRRLPFFFYWGSKAQEIICESGNIKILS